MENPFKGIFGGKGDQLKGESPEPEREKESTVVHGPLSVTNEWTPPENYDQLSDDEKYSETMLRERYDVEAIMKAGRIMKDPRFSEEYVFRLLRSRAQTEDRVRSEKKGV